MAPIDVVFRVPFKDNVSRASTSCPTDRWRNVNQGGWKELVSSHWTWRCTLFIACQLVINWWQASHAATADIRDIAQHLVAKDHVRRQHSYIVPPTLIKLAEWASSVPGMTVWNSVPSGIRNISGTTAFKQRHLNAFLFILFLTF